MHKAEHIYSHMRAILAIAEMISFSTRFAFSLQAARLSKLLADSRDQTDKVLLSTVTLSPDNFLLFLFFNRVVMV